MVLANRKLSTSGLECAKAVQAGTRHRNWPVPAMFCNPSECPVCLYSIPHARALAILLTKPATYSGPKMDKISFVEIWANQGAIQRSRTKGVKAQ